MTHTEQGDDLLRAILDSPGDDSVRLVYADWLEEDGQQERAEILRTGVVKRFGVDFESLGGALTLSSSDIGVHPEPSAWTISGEVHEDEYEWVNDFEANHPEHGLVWGNFEEVVFASSEEGFQHFWKHHEPSAWDYHDI